MLPDFDPHESDEDSSPHLQSSPQLQRVSPHLGPEIETISIPPSPPTSPLGAEKQRQSPTADPGLSALFTSLDGHFSGFVRYPAEALHGPSESAAGNSSPAMTDRVTSGPFSQDHQVVGSTPDRDAAEEPRAVDQSVLEAQAAAALAAHTSREAREHAKRVDSAQDVVPQLITSGQRQESGRATPLKLQTGSSVSGSDDTITTSPTLRKHAIPVEEGNAGTLPALQPMSPTTHGAPGSPQSERLPSCRQLTQLADAAAQQQDTRIPQYSHHHSQSFGSTTAQSPVLPYHIAPNAQMSPNSQYAFSARSPTSTIADHYSSPVQYPGNAYYMERRASMIHENAFVHPTSLPSASSSGESHGPASSSADGYSTSHTTPTDSVIMPDGIHRNIPILPPPRGMPPSAAMMIGGFRCNFEGCEAPPFATQYLLSSHRNVHSSARPHYCPVEGCARSEAGARNEGGRGFKRKNEMIRHGLVHSSPGYVCPFCPEREHKYPRPDNLQRHVRVHHAEKDRDDPLLREVLNQRTEGLGKTRRKRANTGPC